MKAQMGGRVTVVLLHNLGSKRGCLFQRDAPTTLTPVKRPGIRCTGDWVDLGAGLDQ